MDVGKRLELDEESETLRIIKFIQQTCEKLNRSGAIITLSGGLDSALTAKLVVKAFGGKKVQLLHMPEADSKVIHTQHAKRYAQELGVPLQIMNITSTLRKMGVYRLLPIGLLPGKWLRARLVKFGRKLVLNKGEDLLETRLNNSGNKWVNRGNAYGMAKHRVRMITAYQYADANNLMVAGAANLTELLTGTFSKWGVDHCADVMPIMHLYRTQVEQLAEYMGLPEYILRKPADPDLMPGIEDKGNLLGGFLETDLILHSLQSGVPPSEIKENHSPVLVDRIDKLRENSRHMRESPYWLGNKKER